NIGVRIKAAFEAYGVAIDIATDAGVVIPEIVVVQVCFLVGILPREPQRELKRSEPRRILIRNVDPEGFILIPPPHSLPLLIGDEPWRVEVIDLDIRRRCSVRNDRYRNISKVN